MKKKTKNVGPVIFWVLVYIHGFFALAAEKQLELYKQTVYTSIERLPQNSIFSVVQTPDGFIWLATNAGIARFDGVHFDVFNRENTPGKFDLIFLDVNMPEMDGRKATQTIREKGFTEVPIIAMTAHALEKDRDACLEAGMNDYISKPIKREVVFNMVTKWVFKNDEL